MVSIPQNVPCGLDRPVHGHGLRLLPGVERAGGLQQQSHRPHGPLRGSAGLELGLAALLLRCPKPADGADRHPVPGRAGHRHRVLLVPHPQDGRAAAAALPGLAGHGHLPHHPHLEGQPRAKAGKERIRARQTRRHFLKLNYAGVNQDLVIRGIHLGAVPPPPACPVVVQREGLHPRLCAPVQSPCALSLGTVFSSTVEVCGLLPCSGLSASRSDSIRQIRIS